MLSNEQLAEARNEPERISLAAASNEQISLTSSSYTDRRGPGTFKLVRLNDFCTTANEKLKSEYERFLALKLPQINLRLDEPDETWLLINDNDQIAAHVSLWYHNLPCLDGKRPGYIGHYAADDAIAGATILNHATAILSSHDCDPAVGPIDGNTWRRYRFVIESNGTPPFLMEPANPIDYPFQFLLNGFDILAMYSSSIMNVKPEFNSRSRNTSDTADDITIRTIDMTDFQSELKTLFRISIDAFQDNYLYSPITEEEFLCRYRVARQFVHPKLVLIAERRGEAVGYIFALPDPVSSTATSKAVVIKTLARLRDDSLKGTGLKLVHQCHVNAADLGFKRIIHALYKDDNKSNSFSTANGVTCMRKYALFFKPISQTPPLRAGCLGQDEKVNHEKLYL